MSHLKNLSSSDIIGIIAIFLMLVGASALSYHFITEKINSCTSDPIKYAANKIFIESVIPYNNIYFAVYNDQMLVKEIKIDLRNYTSNFSR